MRSSEDCGKGNSPKQREAHVLDVGSVIEEIQDCHIGDYMEGYLTQRNEL